MRVIWFIYKHCLEISDGLFVFVEVKTDGDHWVDYSLRGSHDFLPSKDKYISFFVFVKGFDRLTFLLEFLGFGHTEIDLVLQNFKNGGVDFVIFIEIQPDLFDWASAVRKLFLSLVIGPVDDHRLDSSPQLNSLPRTKLVSFILKQSMIC